MPLLKLLLHSSQPIPIEYSDPSKYSKLSKSSHPVTTDSSKLLSSSKLDKPDVSPIQQKKEKSCAQKKKISSQESSMENC